jgi:hypothetical protein
MTATRSVRYTVVPRLSISAARESARSWRRRTTFSFRLNKPASVALRFTRQTRHGRRRAGTLRRVGHAGLNRVRFRGRISRRKRLRPGRYALRITATNKAGERSTSRRLKFRIVR